MKDFFKKNGKQILALVVLIIAYLVFKGGDISEIASNSTASVSGVVATKSEETTKTKETKTKETKEKKAAEETKIQEDKIEEAEVEEVKSEEPKSEEVKFEEANNSDDKVEITYKFRNNTLLEEHFEKHGEEFPYETKEDYLLGANIMMANPDKLHKTEKEDGDDVYYLEATNEFIIVSKDGYLRTYFKPSKGKKYFDKQ